MKATVAVNCYTHDGGHDLAVGDRVDVRKWGMRFNALFRRDEMCYSVYKNEVYMGILPERCLILNKGEAK
jgi:hypothetical protein